MSRNVLGTLAVTCLLTLAAACGSDDDGGPSTVAEGCEPLAEFDTLEDGVLTVASYEAPPYIGVEDGKPTGADGDILTRVAELNCLDVKAMPLEIAAIIPSVTAGRADVAAGDWYATESRAKEVGVTNPAYSDRMSIVSTTGLANLEDLVGKRVGTLQGNIWNDQLDALVGGGFKLYQNQTGVYTDLKKGRLDAVIDAAASAPRQLELNGIDDAEVAVPEPDSRGTSSEKPALNTFPTTKSNTALVEAINVTIDHMRENGEL